MREIVFSVFQFICKLMDEAFIGGVEIGQHLLMSEWLAFYAGRHEISWQYENQHICVYLRD